MATKTTKSERLELRCTKAQRRIIDQAVELRGGSLTDFILSAAQEKAIDLIRDFQSLNLGGEYSRAFARTLLHAPEPNPRLKRAARRRSSAS